MLRMSAEAMKKIDFSRVFPRGEHELVYMISPTIALTLKNIISGKGKIFGVKVFEEACPDVFGEASFLERLTKFSEIIFSRIERFYNEKCLYIYYDAEEQLHYRKIFFSIDFTCDVSISILGEDGSITDIDFSQISFVEYSKKYKKFLKSTGVQYVAQLDEAVLLINKGKDYDKKNGSQNKKDFFKGKNSAVIKIMQVYPELKDISTKSGFALFVKGKAKILHPDVNKEKDATEKYQEFRKQIEALKKSRWYKDLKEE